MATITEPTKLDKLTRFLAAEINRGVLTSTIKARLMNNGASDELATKLSRLAELESQE